MVRSSVGELVVVDCFSQKAMRRVQGEAVPVLADIAQGPHIGVPLRVRLSGEDVDLERLTLGGGGRGEEWDQRGFEEAGHGCDDGAYGPGRLGFVRPVGFRGGVSGGMLSFVEGGGVLIWRGRDCGCAGVDGTQAGSLCSLRLLTRSGGDVEEC